MDTGPAARRPRKGWREWLRPPRLLRVTRTGKTFLVVTVGVGIGALNTGNNLLYLVLGLLLSLIAVSGVLSERSLRHLRVTRLGADTAFAGEPFAFRWRLEAGKASAYALTLRERGGGLQGEAKVALLQPGETRVLRADVTAPRRGPVPLEAVEISTTFPFGLFSKSLVVELPGTQLVFPRRVASGGAPLSSALPSTGLRAAEPRRGGDGDLLELVELREGEDARRVHWMKSAALGRPVKAERERESDRTFVLQLAPTTDAGVTDALCERAAAQAQRLLREGHAVGLEAGRTRIRAAAGGPQERRLLTALAQVGFEAPSP